MQTLRGRGQEDGLAIRKEDLRIRVTERRDPTTVVFTVDASGSQATARLGEVKGAVELLLAESYRRRDHVALVAFRGTSADLALPPTRSLTRARTATTGLAGGGGTPLAHGLALAGRVASGEARVGRRPMIVLLTDGRPNIPMGEGRSGRQHAKEDAVRVARSIAENRWPVLVVDSARRPQSFTDELAAALGGRMIRLTTRNPRALQEAIAAGVAVGQGVR